MLNLLVYYHLLSLFYGKLLEKYIIMAKIDDIDKKILDVLIENTRTPFTDIAKRLNISAGTVHVRVKKMEESGIIHGSSLTVDYHQLGYRCVPRKNKYDSICIEQNSRNSFCHCSSYYHW